MVTHVARGCESCPGRIGARVTLLAGQGSRAGLQRTELGIVCVFPPPRFLRGSLSPCVPRSVLRSACAGRI